MKNLFVPFDIAVKLKEKGFKELCFGCYQNSTQDLSFLRVGINWCENISEFETYAPTYDQVVNWFREKHNIIIEARLDTYSLNAFKNLGEPCFKFKGFVFCMNTGEYPSENYETKEDAMMKAITIALKLI